MVQLTGRETIVVGECRTCDYKENMLVGRMDLAKWKGGLYIQEAMPYLTAEQRELLISSTCNDCWNRMFPPEDCDCNG